MIAMCSKCGSSLNADVSFCPNCGTPTASYYASSGASSYDATVAPSSFETPSQPPPTDYGSNPYGMTPPNPYDVSPLIPPPPPPPPVRWNKRIPIFIGIGLLVLVLLSASVFTLLAQNKAPLYTADWSNGLNGWTGSSEWSTANGELISNGHWPGSSSAPATTGDDSVLSPYQPSTADYALEARIRILSAPDKCWLALRGRVQRDGSGYNGYFVGFDAYMGDGIIAYFTPSIGFFPLQSKSYSPGSDWHTYRAEFQGNQITLKIDGNSVLQVTNNANPSPGQIGLENGDCQIEVSSFKVIAL